MELELGKSNWGWQDTLIYLCLPWLGTPKGLFHEIKYVKKQCENDLQGKKITLQILGGIQTGRHEEQGQEPALCCLEIVATAKLSSHFNVMLTPP